MLTAAFGTCVSDLEQNEGVFDHDRQEELFGESEPIQGEIVLSLPLRFFTDPEDSDALFKVGFTGEVVISDIDTGLGDEPWSVDCMIDGKSVYLDEVLNAGPGSIWAFGIEDFDPAVHDYAGVLREVWYRYYPPTKRKALVIPKQASYFELLCCDEDEALGILKTYRFIWRDDIGRGDIATSELELVSERLYRISLNPNDA